MRQREVSSNVPRPEPDAGGHQRLQQAYERYQSARTRYRRLLERAPEGQTRGPNHPLTVARRAESEALAEYTRLLKAGEEPATRREEPKTQAAGSRNGG